jgi:hypothetical protein
MSVCSWVGCGITFNHEPERIGTRGERFCSGIHYIFFMIDSFNLIEDKTERRAWLESVNAKDRRILLEEMTKWVGETALMNVLKEAGHEDWIDGH